MVLHLEGAHLQVFNIYIPPATSCPPGYSPDLGPLLASSAGDAVVMGDFNAHHAVWHSPSTDNRAVARGNAILDQVTSSHFCIINEDSPTRVPTAGDPSSPDLTLVSGDLVLEARWCTHLALSSDHLPITVTLDFLAPSLPLPRKTFTNFRKADWEGYRVETEASFAALPPPICCLQGERAFRRVLCAAAKHHIPSGFIPNFTPGLTPETLALTRERDELRARSPTSPRLVELGAAISGGVAREARRSWIERVESCGQRHDSGRFWSLLRSLSGKKTSHTPNQPITFGTRTLISLVPSAASSPGSPSSEGPGSPVGSGVPSRAHILLIRILGLSL